MNVKSIIVLQNYEIVIKTKGLEFENESPGQQNFPSPQDLSFSSFRVVSPFWKLSLISGQARHTSSSLQIL